MNQLNNGMKAPNNNDLFPELATTLLYFIDLLYKKLVENGVEEVYLF